MAIRRESVELSLNDVDFTTGMAKAAATTALLNRELGNLDGSSTRVNRSTSALGDGNGGIAKTGDAARKSSADIDKYSGRLGLLTKTALALGPALVPISASAIPAIAGLTMGLGAAAGAAGVALLAFNGVGDAVKAMDAYALSPTTANLQKMHQAMQDLGPAGANFARFIDGLEPQLRALQGSAREGLFPGVQEGIEELLPLLPKVQDFVQRIGSEMGNLASEAGKGLTGDAGFQKFTHYIDSEGVPIMDAFARSTGKVASGLVALAADMAPLTSDFLGGAEDAADAFDKWAEGLDQTQGFRDFVTYVEHEGPQVVDLLKTVASTGLSIAEAFAPIGSVTLPALTAVAKVIGLIADSPIGPVAATLISLNAAISLGSLAVDKLAFAWKGVAASATAAADAEAVAAGMGGKGRKGLVGKLGIGALIGASLIPAHETETGGLDSANLKEVGSKLGFVNPSIQGFGQGTLNKIFGTADALTGLVGHTSDVTTERHAASSIDQQLAGLVSGGQADQAAAAFAKISAAAKQSGASVNQVAAAFPHYTAALKDNDAASKSDADATIKLATSAKGLSAQFREGTISLSQFRASLSSLHQQALANFDAVTQFGSAVQNAAKQAKDGAHAGLNPFTEAGNANRQAISALIGAYNNQSDAVKNNVGQYQAAKAKLLEFGHQMGATKAQLADLTAEIDKPRRLMVSAETRSALDQIAQVKSYMASLQDRHLTVTVTQHTNAAIGELMANGSADGSTVPKTGKPYADRHLYLLADGEEVVSNRHGQADRFRPLLKAINANRLAGGGTAGSDPSVRQIMNQLDSRKRWDGYDRSELKLVASAMKLTRGLDDLHFATKKQAAASVETAKKTVDADKAAVSALTQHRDAVKADRDSIRASIAARYQSDVFGNVDSSSIAYKIDPKSGRYVDAKQSSVLQLQGITAGLQKDIADAQAAKSAEASIAAALKKQGLSKDKIDAYTLDLEQHGSVGQMQALAESPAIAAQQAQLFAQRQVVSNATGAAIADQVYAQELKISNQHLADMKADLAVAKKEAAAANRRADRVEKKADAHHEYVKNRLAKDTGKQTGSEINHASKER